MVVPYALVHKVQAPSHFTIQALLSPGGVYLLFGVLEGEADRKGTIANSRLKLYTDGLLCSLCIASIEKSVLQTLKVDSH